MLKKISRKLTHKTALLFKTRPQTVKLDRAIISFTFDDFPKSAAEVGSAILDKYGFCASYYCCADLAGKTIHGIRQFDIEQLVELVAAGHEVGCHTASHSAVSRLSREEIREEIKRNNEFLKESDVQVPARSFAYPFGDVSHASKKEIGRNFEVGRGAWAGINAPIMDCDLLKCVSMEPHILSRCGIAEWIRLAIESNGWLIFLTHDVSDEPSPFGVTPEFLEDTVRQASESGAEILTIGAALDRLNYRPQFLPA